MKILDTSLRWITPLIAIAVIANQFYRVETFGLSTWQGGGFGMFSSVDTIYSRFFKIYLKTGGKTVPVKIKGNFEKQTTIARAEPTRENLQQLAKTIFESHWIQSGSFRQDPKTKNTYYPILEIGHANRIALNPKQFINIDGIILELWKTRFDSSTNTITTYKHTEYVYPPNGKQ